MPERKCNEKILLTKLIATTTSNDLKNYNQLSLSKKRSLKKFLYEDHQQDKQEEATDKANSVGQQEKPKEKQKLLRSFSKNRKKNSETITGNSKILNANNKSKNQAADNNNKQNNHHNMFESQQQTTASAVAAAANNQNQGQNSPTSTTSSPATVMPSSAGVRHFIPNIAPISTDSNEACNSTTLLSIPSNSPCSSTDSYDSSLSNSPNSSNSSGSSCNSPNSSNASSSAPIGVNLRVTGQCSQGGRKYMEDYFSVAYQQSENAKDLEYAFIGIFDGHGGAEAAIFAKEHLMMEIIKQKQFWSENDHDVLRAIREGYIATHYAMWRDQENWPRTANGLPSTAGTTATIAFIRREKIYIGHVGDSGIVLGYQNENEEEWRAKALTTDHKPESVQERTRIKRSGGKVMVKSGVPRVVWRRPRNPQHTGPICSSTIVDEIPFLAVARSLGDLWSYNPENREFVVSPDPDVKVVKINPKTFRCLIFGTDGLWNVVTPQEAVNKVQQRERINQRLQDMRFESQYDANDLQWTNPSKGLVEDALKTWAAKRMRADNTSVVTVILYPATEQNKFGQLRAAVPPLTPNSYGLEYTEVQADVPVYEDSITYKELAEKYLPPEAYRNFDYYERAEGGLTGHLTRHNNELQELIEEVAAHEMYPAHLSLAATANKLTADSLQLATEGDSDDDEESDDDDGDEDEHDEDDNDDDETAESDEEAINAERSAGGNLNTPPLQDEDDFDVPPGFFPERDLRFEHWDAAGTSGFSDEAAGFNESLDNHKSHEGHVESDADDNLRKYADIGISFAESFNSLLADQEVAQAQQTNPVKTTTTNYASMQEILHEQECMSEQEGYSLTKLETRQEKQQQQDKKVGLSRQEAEVNSGHVGTTEAANAGSSSSSYNDTSQSPCFWSAGRFQHLQELENIEEAHQQKLLELNSLLQQEHEEEQQVLLERLQLEQLQQAINSKADQQQAEEELELEAMKAETAVAELTTQDDVMNDEEDEDDDDDNDNEDNEQEVQQQSEQQEEHQLIAEAAEIVQAEQLLLEQAQPIVSEWTTPSGNLNQSLYEEYLDEELAAVQINEISSSNITEPSSSSSSSSSADNEEEEQAELTICSSSGVQDDSDASGCSHHHQQQQRITREVIELLEQVEILQPVVDEIDLTQTLSSLEASLSLQNNKPQIARTVSSRRMKLKRNLSKLQCFSNPVTPAKRPRTRSLFPNIPNENQRLTLNTSGHSMKRLRRSPNAVAAAAFNLLQNEKRQLRSSSSTANLQLAEGGGIDYSKRTLRTRNALTKDLKAKSTFGTPKHNSAMNKHFLRQNAAAMLSTNEEIAKCRATSRGNRHQNNNVAAAAAAAVDSSTPSAFLSTKPAVLNLRSRQIDASRAAASNAAVTALSQRAIRSLRSTMSGETEELASQQQQQQHRLAAQSTITTIKITPTSYSKTTKLQQSGNGAIAVAPPPSPKLMNGSNVTATRARSIIATASANAPRAIQAVGNAAQAVASTSNKRPALRSESSTRLAGGQQPPENSSSCDSSSRQQMVSSSTSNSTQRSRLTRKR